MFCLILVLIYTFVGANTGAVLALEGSDPASLLSNQRSLPCVLSVRLLGQWTDASRSSLQIHEVQGRVCFLVLNGHQKVQHHFGAT